MWCFVSAANHPPTIRRHGKTNACTLPWSITQDHRQTEPWKLVANRIGCRTERPCKASFANTASCHDADTRLVRHIKCRNIEQDQSAAFYRGIVIIQQVMSTCFSSSSLAPVQPGLFYLSTGRSKLRVAHIFVLHSHVRFGSKADICAAKRHVRFIPDSDHKSGHSKRKVLTRDRHQLERRP
jgi:hypothetical protein